MIRILIAEDSALMRKLLTGIFVSAGDFEVAVARDGLDALAQVAAFQPDVVTLDINMPKLDGLACLDRIMLEHPVPVVMVSALTEEGADETLTALGMGAVDFIAKPEGVISLHIDAMAAELVSKVRAAAAVQLPRSRRLAERVRLRRLGAARPSVPVQVAPRVTLDGASPGLVLVGCSTGGPPALDILLSSLPSDLAWPIVIAQHMPASFTGPLARRLDKLTALSVQEVTGPTPLLPGCAYVARGGADIVIGMRGGQSIANAAPMQADYPWHPSVDRLVRSAMESVQPTRLMGILLTGMGSDGATAMAELRAAGGHTVAEAKETAVVWGMPGELVALGGAAKTLPLDEIPAHVAALLT